jgi:NADPH:quinone reductase-like Zn-dependent oxidoreductase
MKALVYETAHTLDNFAIKLSEVAEPTLRKLDVLVDIHAIAINPGETFFRRTRSAEPGARVLLGWEFAGVVIETGPSVRQFKIGDRVFGTGDLSRDGSWAERLAIDSRIITKIPDQISFVDAASIPIGALTAWEAMFRDQGALPTGVDRVLIVGGAGSVGSLATQLLKAKTKAFIISTASRPESRQWCLDMGADLVIDHAKDTLKKCAEGARDRRRKTVGVVVVAAGKAKAPVIFDCMTPRRCASGLITHLIIDSDLESALVDLIESKLADVKPT